jgi:hypothetical protein
MDGALQSARLRGAELSEVASEVASELVEQISEYSARILQDIVVNGTVTDEERHRGGKDDNSGAIITSNSIFGISFNSIIQFTILGAIGFFAYKYYQKNLKN